MTVSMQGLDPDEQHTFTDLLENNPAFADRLGPLVQQAIDAAGSSALRDTITNLTRGLMAEFTGARIEVMIDQSFKRQIEGVVDKAISDTLAQRSDQFRSEIARVVEKAVDAKFNVLKNKALTRALRKNKALTRPLKKGGK